ncbi:MAG: hypothetical protein KDN22_10250 [Verrucomicrobiae bacterium]|nr:hypothetical protein [Verrucomicrobiae bacterium]
MILYPSENQYSDTDNAIATTLKVIIRATMSTLKTSLAPIRWIGWIRWIAVSAITFALGWHLKPAQIIEPASNDGAAQAMTMAPATTLLTNRDRRPANRDGGDNVARSGGRRALNSERIAELGERLRRTTDPIARREAFAELLAGLTAENALEIREQVAHLNDNDPDFRDFHYAWGQVAGLEAVLHGLETTDKKDMGPSLAGWASADPSAALEWYNALENEGNQGANQQSMKAALVHGLAIADPDTAADFVYSLGEAGDKRAKEMMGIVMGKVVQSGGAQEAAQWATHLGGGEGGELRGHALWEAGRAGVRENADATLAWASDLARSDPNAGNLAYGVAQEMGWRDGPKVAEWLGSLDNDGVTSAYGPLLGGWTKTDPLAASEYVAAMPPSESRDWAIGGMVYTHRWEDPAAAAAWATQLSSAEGREKVITLAAEAYVSKDPAGAADWLPTSGLPIETQQRLVQGEKKAR